MATGPKASGKPAREPASGDYEAAGDRPSRSDLYAMGKSLRDKCPRDSHAIWKAPAKRPDPLKLLEESYEGRIPQLIPIRHGRMARTPFTFYRGAALHMAADLAVTPASGLRVQACGDAHLLNFGAFATPERREIFDINDLDETLPAPWEWDIKRLAASVVVACRDNGFSDAAARDAVLSCVRSYREHMADYSQMRVLDVWYSRIDLEDLIASITDKKARKRERKRFAATRARSVAEHDFPKLVQVRGQGPTIKDNPPLIFHPPWVSKEQLFAMVRAVFSGYRESIQEDRRTLLDRFEIKDIAIKVVGVGSVGTFCNVLLLMANEEDPLFLQGKQARTSVLEPYAGKSIYANQGQRVVNGYRLMQSASDIFLGWTEGVTGVHFYVRQLRDMKLAMLVELFSPAVMTQYAEVCGWTLARAHARSGSPAAISGYLGKSDAFDKAIAKFSFAYADQSERDHAVLRKAVRSGRVEAVMETE